MPSEVVAAAPSVPVSEVPAEAVVLEEAARSLEESEPDTTLGPLLVVELGVTKVVVTVGVEVLVTSSVGLVVTGAVVVWTVVTGSTVVVVASTVWVVVVATGSTTVLVVVTSGVELGEIVEPDVVELIGWIEEVLVVAAPLELAVVSLALAVEGEAVVEAVSVSRCRSIPFLWCLCSVGAPPAAAGTEADTVGAVGAATTAGGGALPTTWALDAGVGGGVCVAGGAEAGAGIGGGGGATVLTTGAFASALACFLAALEP